MGHDNLAGDLLLIELCLCGGDNGNERNVEILMAIACFEMANSMF